MKSVLIALVATSFVATTAFASGCTYERQVDLLAKVMYHEARGEENDGMVAVGEVVMNRLESPNYPDNICKVILAPFQFSPNVRKGTPSGELWDASVELAKDLIDGEADIVGHGATHFLNPEPLKRLPGWTKRFDKVGRIGNHVFYADGSTG